MKVVIIGSGIAGIRVREEVSRLSPGVDLKIISRDSVPPYSKVAMSHYVAGEIDRARVLLPVEVPPAEMITATTVESIDRARRVVHALRGSGRPERSEIPYDVLVLATGATPSTRFGAPFWRLEDADRVVATTAAGQTAAVVGGGFVGIHLAQALARRGLCVTIFEKQDTVLPGRVPERIAAFVQQRLEGAGIRCVVNATTPAACDFVHCFDCTGARPDTSLAEAAGLDMCPGGIIVDERQRTSDPYIYAIGDCAAVRWYDGSVKSAGLWYACQEQALIAARALLGIAAEYPPFAAWNTFSIPVADGGEPVVGVSFGRMVPGKGDTVDDTIVDTGDPDKGTYRCALVNDGKVLGYCAIGDAGGPGNLLRMLGQHGNLPVLPAPDLYGETPSLFAVTGAFEASVQDPDTARIVYKGVQQ